MAGWTKQDYADNYSVGVERHLRPPCPNTRKPVKLAYCHWATYPFIKARLDPLIEILSLDRNDRVLLVGCGFGWGVEYLIEKVGCVTIGTDISDWIHSVKHTDESEDILAEIVKVGLDPHGERAQQILDFCSRPGPRTRSVILNEDLMTLSSRESIQPYFGNTNPTVIITEDMIQLLTDAEITGWVHEVDLLAATVCHLHNGNPRTNEQLHALTGHKCFQYGVNKILGMAT
jgi:hypothetical protein